MSKAFPCNVSEGYLMELNEEQSPLFSFRRHCMLVSSQDAAGHVIGFFLFIIFDKFNLFNPSFHSYQSYLHKNKQLERKENPSLLTPKPINPLVLCHRKANVQSEQRRW